MLTADNIKFGRLYKVDWGPDRVISPMRIVRYIEGYVHDGPRYCHRLFYLDLRNPEEEKYMTFWYELQGFEEI